MKIAQKRAEFWQSGEISPNLVPLAWWVGFKTKQEGKIEGGILWLHSDFQSKDVSTRRLLRRKRSQSGFMNRKFNVMLWVHPIECIDC